MHATDDISDSLRKALTRKRISNNKSTEASSALIMNDSSHTIAGKYSTLEHERKRSTQKRKQKRLSTSIGLGQRVIAKAAETLETQRLIHHNNQMNKICNDKSGNTRRSSFQILRPKRSGSNLLDLSKHSGSALDISKHSIFSFGLESGSLSADSSRHITGTQEPYVSSTSRAPEIEAESNIKTIIDSIKSEGGEVSELFKLFSEHANEDGELGPNDFFKAYAFIDPQLSQAEVMNLFHEADFDGAGSIDFEEFLSLTTSPHLKLQAMKQINFRDKNNSLVQIKPAEGPFFDGAYVTMIIISVLLRVSTDRIAIFFLPCNERRFISHGDSWCFQDCDCQERKFEYGALRGPYSFSSTFCCHDCLISPNGLASRVILFYHFLWYVGLSNGSNSFNVASSNYCFSYQWCSRSETDASPEIGDTLESSLGYHCSGMEAVQRSKDSASFRIVERIKFVSA